MKYCSLFLALVLLVTFLQKKPAQRAIDLTYPFDANTIYWPNNPDGFKLDTLFNGTTPGGWYYSSNAICAPEHGGTHLDAPVHFAKGGYTTERIPLERLIGPGLRRV